MFFVSLFGTIAVLVATVVGVIGNYLGNGKMVVEQAIVSPFEALLGLLTKRLDDTEIDLKWLNYIPAFIFLPVLILMSFLVFLFFINVGSIVLTFTIFTFSETLMPLADGNITIYNVIAHVIFFTSMTYLVWKSRKMIDELFIGGPIKAILGKSESTMNSFSDDVGNALTNIYKKTK